MTAKASDERPKTTLEQRIGQIIAETYAREYHNTWAYDKNAEVVAAVLQSRELTEMRRLIRWWATNASEQDRATWNESPEEILDRCFDDGMEHLIEWLLRDDTDSAPHD